MKNYCGLRNFQKTQKSLFLKFSDYHKYLYGIKVKVYSCLQRTAAFDICEVLNFPVVSIVEFTEIS